MVSKVTTLRRTVASLAFSTMFALCLLCFWFPFSSSTSKASSEEPAAAAQGKVPAFKTTGGGTPSASSEVKVRTTIDSLVRNWLRVPTLEHSTVGLEIMELPSGKVMYSYNGAKRFTPASTAKAITTACAYDTFGPNFVYKTSVIAEGTISNSVLHGNLVIVPSQDPTLTKSQLGELIKQAVQQTARIDGKSPIAQIDGQVKLLTPVDLDRGFHQSWLVEDWGRYWMPVSSNLVLDENIANSGDLQLIENYRVIDAANTHGALFDVLLNSPDGPSWIFVDRANRALFTYRPHHPQAPKEPSYAVANPDDYNLTLVEGMVKQHGIKALNQPINFTSKENVYQLAQHCSEPLPKILTTCLHESDNLYAQQLLRTLGAQTIAQSKDAKNGSSAKKDDGMSLEDRGILAISRWLSKIGVPGQEIILFDGCGLCRKNGVSPHGLNLIMKHMAGEKVNGAFLQLLKANDESDSGKGAYRFKTGTMDSIRAMTGVLTTAGNENLAVTVMVNGHIPSVRNLRIAVSALISQLRVIRHIGAPAPKEMVGSPDDPNITISTHEPINVNMQALAKKPPAKHGRGRHRRRR